MNDQGKKKLKAALVRTLLAQGMLLAALAILQVLFNIGLIESSERLHLQRLTMVSLFMTINIMWVYFELRK